MTAPETDRDAALEALRAVVDATRSVERALEPLDLAVLDKTLRARAEAVERLGALVESGGAVHGTRGGGAAARRELAAEAAELDARVRTAAAGVLAGVRAELRDLRCGQETLAGYRGFSRVAPRFTDRRG